MTTFKVTYHDFATGERIGTEYHRACKDFYEGAITRGEEVARAHGSEVDIRVCDERIGVRVRP